MRSQSSLLEDITGEKQSITIRQWFDRHLHVRSGEMRSIVLAETLRQKAFGAVFMGNLEAGQETSTFENAWKYKKEIVSQTGDWQSDFRPIMTCYLTDYITPNDIVEGFKLNVWGAVKMYLAGATGGTTNSHRGVTNLLGRYHVFEMMEKHGIPLLGHFEAVEPEVDEFDREAVSLDKHLRPIVQRFPNLNIVVEHVTDQRMAQYVAANHGRVYATVTAHHLFISRNAMFSGGMNPGHYCKPVPKRKQHQLYLRQIITSGNERFGAGTDSAPHDVSRKSQCYGCAAGIFTAPCAVELYTTVFDEENALDKLEKFLSTNFLHIYGVKPSEEKMTIVRKSWEVPKEIGNIPVFMGGKTLNWKLE